MSILHMFRSWLLNGPSAVEVEQTKDLYYNERFFSGTQGLKAARYCQIPYNPSPSDAAAVKTAPLLPEVLAAEPQQSTQAQTSPGLDSQGKDNFNSQLNSHGYSNQQGLVTRKNPTSVGYLAVNPHESKPTLVSLFLDQAKGYSRQSKWDEAIEICRKVLVIDPHQIAAHRLMGTICRAKEQPYVAIGHYANALTLQPQSAEIYSDLGALYQDLEEWERAIDYYQKAIDLASAASTSEAIAASKVAQAGLIESQIQHQRQPKEAPHSVDSVYHSLTLSPETFTAQEHCEMAYLLLQQGDGDNAMECFRRAIQCRPSHGEAHLQLASLLEERQQWQEAMLHYKQAVQVVEPSTQMPLTQGQAQHKFIAAAPDVTPDVAPDAAPKVALNAMPNTVADHPQTVSEPGGDAYPSIEASSTDLSSSPVSHSPSVIKSTSLASPTPVPLPDKDTDATDADPLISSVQAFLSLALSYEQHGDIEKAITHYRNALSLDPRNQDIHQKLNLVLAQQTA